MRQYKAGDTVYVGKNRIKGEVIKQAVDHLEIKFKREKKTSYQWFDIKNVYDSPFIEMEKQENMKYDSGKLRYSLLVPEFIEEMIKVLEFGAKKYKPDSWKGIDKQRYSDALFRHFSAYIRGSKKDGETGLSELAHIAVNAMFINYLEGKDENN